MLTGFPFFYRPDFKVLEDGWTSFSPEEEFSKLLLQHRCSAAAATASDPEWRISHVNRDFSVCRSYPPSVVVPAAVTDEQLRASAAFRHGGRFPVLSYRHPATGKAILRASQPLCGPNLRRCREDERILAVVLGKDRRGFVIDTRTQVDERTKVKVEVGEGIAFLLCHLGHLTF